MVDFSPLAVKQCQGLGRVVTGPSAVLAGQSEVTTSLPCRVRKFRYNELIDILWVDETEFIRWWIAAP
jgi:hypothetical protein